MTLWSMRKLHGYKENAVGVLRDVTAYAEMCLPSSCLETVCITPLFYCCMRVLLSRSCFCGSAVLAWSKYAKLITKVCYCLTKDAL
jgi:hypothetical protein